MVCNGQMIYNGYAKVIDYQTKNILKDTKPLEAKRPTVVISGNPASYTIDINITNAIIYWYGHDELKDYLGSVRWAIPGCQLSYAGCSEPELPFMTITTALPERNYNSVDERDIKVSIVECDYMDFNATISYVSFEDCVANYQFSGFYPSSLFETNIERPVDDPFDLGLHKMTTNLFLAQYNHESKTIRAYTHIKLLVEIASTAFENENIQDGILNVESTQSDVTSRYYSIDGGELPCEPNNGLYIEQKNTEAKVRLK